MTDKKGDTAATYYEDDRRRNPKKYALIDWLEKMRSIEEFIAEDSADVIAMLKDGADLNVRTIVGNSAFDLFFSSGMNEYLIQFVRALLAGGVSMEYIVNEFVEFHLSSLYLLRRVRKPNDAYECGEGISKTFTDLIYEALGRDRRQHIQRLIVDCVENGADLPKELKKKIENKSRTLIIDRVLIGIHAKTQRERNVEGEGSPK